jgi:hypothetical protein
MTREEKLEKYLNRQYLYENGDPSYIHGIKVGVSWADENPKSPWISTDDFLPKIINNGGYSDTVLVIDENNNIELAIYSFYRGAWIRAYGNDDIDDSIIQNNITHWMKIPKN